MIRFIHGMEYRARVDGKNLKDLSWLSIPDRERFFRMSHLFRVRHKLAPGYLLPNFKSISEAHSHNTRGSAHNFVLNRELSLSQTGFAFQAIKQWNDSPNDIMSIKVFRVFKWKLKEFFISQYDWLLLILSDGFKHVYDSGILSFLRFLRLILLSVFFFNSTRGPLWE